MPMFPVSIKGVLLVDSGKAVLAKNDRGEWELPGGRIEIGEDSETCVQREFEEELGVKVSAERLIDAYLFEVVPGKYVFIVTFGCRLQGPFEPRLSHEHQELGTFAVEALPARLPSGYRASIEAWHAAA
jgi:8-oxo-dGTP pyrophosphatase MutT (NUDIX family)